MDDENKITEEGVSEELPVQEETAPEAPACEETAPEAPAEELMSGEELEQLRETFQQQYDETVKQADEIVIQELDEIAEEEAAEEESEEAAPAPVKKKKEKKPLSTGGKIGIAVAATLGVVIILIGIVVALFFKESKDSANFITNMTAYDTAIAEAQASAAKIGAEDAEGTEYQSALDSYNTAIGYCTDEGWLSTNSKIAAVDEAVTLVYENQGYAEAYSFLAKNLTEKQMKKCSSKAAKTVIETAEKIKKAACSALGEIFAGDADIEAIAAKYDVGEDNADQFKTALATLREGYEADIASTDSEAKNTAMSKYSEGFGQLATIGAGDYSAAEALCCALSDAGCMYSALVISAQAVNDDDPQTAAYKTFLEKKASLTSMSDGICALAEQAKASGKTGDEAVVADGMDESVRQVLVTVVDSIIEALDAEESHNLTKAGEAFQSAQSTAAILGFDDPALAYRSVKCLFDCGSIPTAQSMAEEYLTEEAVSKLDKEKQAEVDRMNEVFEALSKTSEVFSSFYQAVYYGGSMDFEGACAALDELEINNKYDTAFVNYCKYYAALYTEEETDTTPYLEGMKENAPDLPFLYGYYYIDKYIDEDNYEEAVKVADELLAVNCADDYALSVKAEYARLQGDLDTALATALEGVELLGDDANYCAKEAALANMLKEDYDSAYRFVKAYYNAGLTIESCDLVLILNALYKGDAETKTAIEELAAEVNSTYEQYGVTSKDDTLAIIDGTKTFGDVYGG